MKLENIIPKELKEKKATRCHNMQPNKALMNKVFRGNFGAIIIGILPFYRKQDTFEKRWLVFEVVYKF